MLLKSLFLILPIVLVSTLLYAGVTYKNRKEASDLPELLSFRIGGFFGGFNSINFNSKTKTLTLSHSSTTKKLPCKNIDLSNREWQELHSLLKKANVWNWKKDYIDKRILDGTQWSLNIKWGSKSISSNGSNQYPNKKEWDLLNGKLFSYFRKGKPSSFLFRSYDSVYAGHKFTFNPLTDELTMLYSESLTKLSEKTILLDETHLKKLFEIFQKYKIWGMEPSNSKSNKKTVNTSWDIRITWDKNSIYFQGPSEEKKLIEINNELASFFK